jgi:hypothetical protein
MLAAKSLATFWLHFGAAHELRNAPIAKRREMRRSLIGAVLLTVVLPTTAGALPPRPPSAAKSRIAIRHLKIAQPLSLKGYGRDRFPHWISQGGGCDTRERPGGGSIAVLKRPPVIWSRRVSCRLAAGKCVGDMSLTAGVP